MSEEYLRDRLDELETLLDSLDEPESGTSSDVVQTVTVGTYPTDAESYYAVQPIGIGGDVAEGSSPTFSPDTDRTYYALNLGSEIPPEGTKLVVSACGGRWVFRYDGAP